MLRAEVFAENGTVRQEHRAAIKIQLISHDRREVAVIFYKELTGIAVPVFTFEHVLGAHVAAHTGILDLHIDCTGQGLSCEELRLNGGMKRDHCYGAVGTLEIGNFAVICVTLKIMMGSNFMAAGSFLMTDGMR